MAAKKGRKSSPSVIAKEPLAKAINDIIKERELTQTEAAWIIKDAPSQLSLIATGNLKGFSAERLLRILTRFGNDVEIQVKKSSGKEGKVRISVR